MTEIRLGDQFSVMRYLTQWTHSLPPTEPSAETAVLVGQGVQNIHAVVKWQQRGNPQRNMNLTHLLSLARLW